MSEGPIPPEVPGPVYVDDLIATLQAVARRYWPDAEWASVVVKRPGLPNIVFVVNPATDLPAESRPASPQAL